MASIKYIIYHFFEHIYRNCLLLISQLKNDAYQISMVGGSYQIPTSDLEFQPRINKP